MKDNDIQVPHIWHHGKRWIFEPYSLHLQCAYCIFIQPLKPIRDDTGLVVSLRMVVEDESHSQDCPQANDKGVRKVKS